MVNTTQPPLAAIDAGSNTVHLVVARPTNDGRDLRTLDDRLELVRLGADVSASGAIGEARAARAVVAIREQAARARELGAEIVLGIATEGVRAASNARDFLGRVERETGVRLELVTGDQEAALTYWGVTSAALPDGRAAGERQVVLDLGGGSLELVVGSGAAIEWRVSLPLGSGAVHDRYAPSDPPAATELAAARAVATAALELLRAPLPVAGALACGGTATALAALAARTLPEPDAMDGEEVAVGGAGGPLRALSPATLERLVALLQAQPAAEIAATYRIAEERARLLAAGAMVLLAAMARLGVDRLQVSRRGIREGALLAYVRAGNGWLEAARRGALP